MRAEGYYFVRWTANGNWTLGYWDGSVWRVMGEGDLYPDSAFAAWKWTPIQSESQVIV